MTEFNVTDIVAGPNAPDHWYLSNSVSNLGCNAAQLTWENCLGHAERTRVLRTADDLEAMRDHLRAYGAWDEDEIKALTDRELNAFALQEIAAEVNELTNYYDIDLDSPLPQDQYATLEQAWEDGQLSGRLYPVLSDNSTQWFYSIGE